MEAYTEELENLNGKKPLDEVSPTKRDQVIRIQSALFKTCGRIETLNDCAYMWKEFSHGHGKQWLLVPYDIDTIWSYMENKKSMSAVLSELNTNNPISDEFKSFLPDAFRIQEAIYLNSGQAETLTRCAQLWAGFSELHGSEWLDVFPDPDDIFNFLDRNG